MLSLIITYAGGSGARFHVEPGIVPARPVGNLSCDAWDFTSVCQCIRNIIYLYVRVDQIQNYVNSISNRDDNVVYNEEYLAYVNFSNRIFALS